MNSKQITTLLFTFLILNPTQNIFSLKQAMSLASGVLHVGANNSAERVHYNKFPLKKVIWIEAIPKIFEQLKENLSTLEKTGVTHIPIMALVTDKDDEEYTFHLFNWNQECSSIFAPNNDNIGEFRSYEIGNIKLKSKKLSTVLKENNIEPNDFDYVVLNVQGAELVTLKGFGDYLKNVKWLEIEISQKEYYKSGVLFPELNNYLEEQGFVLTPGQELSSHCDVLYQRS